VILVLRREAEADILKPGLGPAFVNVVDDAFERLAEASIPRFRRGHFWGHRKNACGKAAKVDRDP
jgi:hypothetical protein